MITAPFRVALVCACVAFAFGACGGDDDAEDTAGTAPSDTTTATSAMTATGATTAADVTAASAGAPDTTAATDTPVAPGGAASTATATAPAGGGTGEELDICALVTQQDVEAAIGMPAGPAQPDSMAPFFGCRYELETDIVTVGVWVWDDADAAEASFEMVADQYPAVEGVGDRAYNSEPFDDLTVLSGRYEISVGLFLSLDDADQLAMARDLAALLIERLP